MTSGRGRPPRRAPILGRDALSRATTGASCGPGGFAVWARRRSSPCSSCRSRLRRRRATDSRSPPGSRSLLLFGAAFWRATARRAAAERLGVLLLVAGQAAAVYSLVALPPCFGLEGALLVLVALQLGALLRRPFAMALDPGLQSAGLLCLVWLHWDWHWGVVLAFAYLPFQLVADAMARLLDGETAAREAISRPQRRARGHPGAAHPERPPGRRARPDLPRPARPAGPPSDSPYSKLELAGRLAD